MGHIYANHPSRSSGDIDSAGKVAINLYAVEQQTDQYDRPLIILIMIEHLINQDRRPVCNHDLLEKSPKDQLGPMGQIGIGKPMPLVKLLRQLIVPGDRPLYDLRKEGNEQDKAWETLISLNFSSVQVDDIGGRLKSIEGNSQRDQSSEVKNSFKAQRLKESAEVLDRCQYAEVDQQDEKNHLSLFLLYCGLQLLFFFTGKFAVFAQILFVPMILLSDIPPSEKGNHRRKQ